MSQYVLINRIRVQGANAIAGFTWGFPAITHFLGFTQNLALKLSRHDMYKNICLSGCAVIAHQHKPRTYGNYNELTQSRNPPYLFKKKKNEKEKYISTTPPVMEEGKMDMIVSLLISYKGNTDDEDSFCDWIKNTCYLQRLAGGSIQDISNIELFTINSEQDNNQLRLLTRKLLPGFVLLDRSDHLEKHYQELQGKDQNAELFGAWLDFIALKKKARPVCNLITQHFIKQAESNPEDEQHQKCLNLWHQHLDHSYERSPIPDELRDYFKKLPKDKTHKKLLEQWENYCSPNEKTDAIWEYVKKPEQGFLIPIVTGYKAISPVYKNHEVANTRDNETDICFAEAVHSIGEWQGIHRIRDATSLQQTLWHYHYEENWYLCKQQQKSTETYQNEMLEQAVEDDFS